MNGICDSDKKILLNDNLDLIINFTQCVSLGNVHKPESMKYIFEKIQQCQQTSCLLTQVLNELNLTPQVNLENSIRYQQIFTSPWAPNIILEERHEQLTQKIRYGFGFN